MSWIAPNIGIFEPSARNAMIVWQNARMKSQNELDQKKEECKAKAKQ
jgi:hypothetical protein